MFYSLTFPKMNNILITILLSIIAIQFAVELIKVMIWLEKHEYINGSYQHSAQHFAYLWFYFIGVVLFLFQYKPEFALTFIAIGTIVLNFHIRSERLGRV